MSTFPLIRHLSVHVTPVLARLPVHASQITAVSLLAGLASGWCMMQGERTWGIIGGVLLVISYVLDNCDGEIARLKNQSSRFGMHFDNFVDTAVHTFFFAALGVGIKKTTGQDAWLWLGSIAAAGSAINGSFPAPFLFTHDPLSGLDFRPRVPTSPLMADCAKPL